MRRILITGISGFVGKYLLEYFSSLRKEYQIFGINKHNIDLVSVDCRVANKVKIYNLSMLEGSKLKSVIKKINPDAIVHLACLSSVVSSWQNPKKSFLNNTNICLNLLEAVRQLNLKCRILSIGSSEEYGIISSSELPVNELSPLSPHSPYAVARVAQESLSLLYQKAFGIPVICTRSFNHIGPRQDSKFVISSFARQAVEIKMGKRKELVCGDIDITRDFIDVRDVVRAYHLLLDNGRPGEIYNVCSGKGYKLSEIINAIKDILGIDFPVVVDQNLYRPVDNPIIIGSPQKIIKKLGFKFKFKDIRISLQDMLDFWEGYCRSL